MKKETEIYNKFIRILIHKVSDFFNEDFYNDINKQFTKKEKAILKLNDDRIDDIVSMIIRKSKHKNRGNKKAGGYKIEDVNRWLDQLRLFCSQEDKEYNTPVKIEYIIDRLESTIKGNDTLIKRANDLRNIRNFFKKINIKENYFDIEKMFNEGYDNETIILFLKIKIDKNKSLLTFDASNVIR